jgi:GH15 family glucan-1,4-alpha-glucosidase
LTLADYALVGNSRSSALISRDGSVDWLCLPRPDSPSVFGRILDPAAGRLTVQPLGDFTATRRYVPGTNVLETVFRTSTGSLRLRDAMTVAADDVRRQELLPEHELLRELTGLEGSVEVEVVYEPRPDYARRAPKLVDRRRLGVWAECGPAAVILLSDVPLAVDAERARAGGRLEIRGGDTRYVSFSFARDAPAVVAALGEGAERRMRQTVDWWQGCAENCGYQGPYGDAVVRSLLTLRLMIYAPSGAILAAPTTSLPEDIGGVRNWDYRYCWLRDTSLTVRALLALGYEDEAAAFTGWLLHTTRLSWPDLQVVYDVFGGPELPEYELPHLAGYCNSRPVRIGNGACKQFQLDVYGEVLDAVAQYFIGKASRLDSATRHMLLGLGETVCRRWTEPDEGIWEVRSGPDHHTHSKALAWVAVDRLLRLHEAGLLDLPAGRYRAIRDAIRSEIETRGWNESLGSYVRTFDGDELDASLLLLPIYGYADAHSPRMRSTIERIVGDLRRGPGVVRYVGQDGVEGGEGAFGIVSFWAVEALALAGQVDRARAMFEDLLTCANDVGLFAEEFDPNTREPLGNFPQAFTHVGLINAALALGCVAAEQEGGEQRVEARA